MSVVNGPPPAHHLVKWAVAVRSITASKPWLVGPDEVYHVDTGLEVPVGRDVLVMGRGRDIVGEAQAVKIVLEVHVEQALVGSVEGDAPLSHGHHGVVITQIWGQNHDTRVEEVRPANVRRRREGMRSSKQLIGGSEGDNVGIDVDNFGELRLLPQIEFGEGGMEVAAIHEVQIGRVVVAYPWHGEYVVVNGLGRGWSALRPMAGGKDIQASIRRSYDRRSHLELGNGIGGDGIECDQNG
jgi:hypothetical protein